MATRLRLPELQGVIRRRLLVNYRVDPEVIQRRLPEPFRPKLQQGQAIAGVCLIRLERIRPKGFPAWLGLSSENAAHRVAVVWEEDGEPREGVYIPRRDSSSLINRVAGGRLFPGEHRSARFTIQDRPDAVTLRMRSADGHVQVEVSGHVAEYLPADSLFASTAQASAFFEAGHVGYSDTRSPERLDAIELRTDRWAVSPLEIERVYSSYFSDTEAFPPGSAEFDHALLMRDIEHSWHMGEEMYVDRAS